MSWQNSSNSSNSSNYSRSNYSRSSWRSNSSSGSCESFNSQSGRGDSIVFQSDYPEYTIWKPYSQYKLCVDVDDYTSFENISRVVHFTDFIDIYDSKIFTNYSLSTDNHCSLENPNQFNVDYEGLFFGPEVPRKQHNWYGNVSFKCNIDSFLNRFKLNIFYVETVDYNTNSCSRILLTYKYYHNLRHYNPRIYGGPWGIDEDGYHFHLTNARRFDSDESSRHGHALEFMIELSEDQLEDLFHFCKIEAVNHSQTMSGYRKCRKHQTGRHWQRCPSTWGIEYTRRQLRNYGI